MSDLEKRVEHWLEYGKEYRWSNEFMTFLSDVKTAFLAPREEEPEMRLKRYETTIDGEYVTVLKSALEWLESVALALTPPQKPERWVCHGCGAEWNRQPGNHWYMDNQGKPCGPVEPQK